MADYRITCIKRSHPQGGHEHITYVGGPEAGGWTLSRADAVSQIDNHQNSFHVTGPTGKRAEVGVITPATGPKYLRTHADGVWNDNLLSLPPCK